MAEGRRHFVGQSTGDNHDVGLAGGGAEDYAEAVLVVARGGEVHHFDSAAGEAEGHGPKGALAGPVGDLVECCSGVRSVKGSLGMSVGYLAEGYGNVQCVLHGTFLLFLAW